MIIGEAVFSFFSIYAPQSGLSETELFYDNLQTTVSKVPVSESLIIVADWNGHVDKMFMVVMVTVLATLTEKESLNLLLQISLL